MKRLAGLLALLWCLPNVVVAYWMVQGAFIAKTAQHEGLLAQIALLVGGLLIAIFTGLLGRLGLGILARPDEASGA